MVFILAPASRFVCTFLATQTTFTYFNHSYIKVFDSVTKSLLSLLVFITFILFELLYVQKYFDEKY